MFLSKRNLITLLAVLLVSLAWACRESVELRAVRTDLRHTAGMLHQREEAWEYVHARAEHFAAILRAQQATEKY